MVAFIVMWLAALAIGVHMAALRGYENSFSASMPLTQREAGAARAHKLEPWNAQFATRATVMQKWLQGSTLLAHQDYLHAMQVLADAYRLDVGDKELLALFKKSQDDLTVNTNFKAHVQHGHEGPGGTLRPQDLMP